MLAPQLLLETLKDLNNHDFDEFKWFLGQKILEGCEKIPKCDLESPHRHHTVSKMVETYGEEMAVNMMVSILKKMKHNNAAEELQKTHRDGAAAQEKVSRPPATSSPASGLPTGQKKAGGAAGAVALRAPTATNSRVITSGNVGNCNVVCDFSCIVDCNVNMTINGNVGNIVFTSGNDGSVITSGNVASNVQSNFGGLVGGNVVISDNSGSNVAGVLPSNFHGNVKGDVGSDFRGVGKYIHETVTRRIANGVAVQDVHHHYHYYD